MRYCFSGHESFPCKSMWLKKGYDYLVDHNKFTDPDAVVKLGVGKNMVQSIRFWLRAFGLLNNDEATELLIIFLMKEMEEILMPRIMPPYGFFIIC